MIFALPLVMIGYCNTLSLLICMRERERQREGERDRGRERERERERERDWLIVPTRIKPLFEDRPQKPKWMLWKHLFIIPISALNCIYIIRDIFNVTCRICTQNHTKDVTVRGFTAMSINQLMLKTSHVTDKVTQHLDRIVNNRPYFC